MLFYLHSGLGRTRQTGGLVSRRRPDERPDCLAVLMSRSEVGRGLWALGPRPAGGEYGSCVFAVSLRGPDGQTPGPSSESRKWR